MSTCWSGLKGREVKPSDGEVVIQSEKGWAMPYDEDQLHLFWAPLARDSWRERMNIRTNSIGVIAQRVIANLRKNGCQVLAVKGHPGTPMIEIAYPTDELGNGTLELKEQVNGLRRRAYAARLGGCIVHWHEDLPQDDFERPAT